MTSRRLALQWLAASAAGVRLPAQAHALAGWVKPPRPVPAWPLTLANGQTSTMKRLLQGRNTALQLMFTGCSSTCPLQGALFAQVQQRLAGEAAVRARSQLVSLSVDPLGDSPAAMARWLAQFGAGPQWVGAVPPVAQLDALLEFFDGKSNRGMDWHVNAVFLFNARAELVLRSVEHPAPAEVVRWLAELPSPAALPR
jgi:protein SCO1/2